MLSQPTIVKGRRFFTSFKVKGTRETKTNELRTLQARENSFEYDYHVLSSELRQNQLAETNERTLVIRSSYANLIVNEKGSTGKVSLFETLHRNYTKFTPVSI